MAKRLRKRVSKKARTAPEEDTAAEPIAFEGDGAAPPEPRADTSTALTEPAATKANAEPADGASTKKRKRTRKRKRPHVPYAGPNVESMDSLGESAKRAIAYAQLFLTDKSAWKFSKQKQNWLLRHMLWSPALVEAGQALLDVTVDMDEAVRSATPPAVSMPETGAWVDDEHVPVVAHYLQSMMGLAKQRLMETLAAAASLPPAPVPSSDAAQGSSDPAAEAAPKLTQWFSLRAARASALLEWIEACQDTPNAM